MRPSFRKFSYLALGAWISATANSGCASGGDGGSDDSGATPSTDSSLDNAAPHADGSAPTDANGGPDSDANVSADAGLDGTVGAETGSDAEVGSDAEGGSDANATTDAAPDARVGGDAGADATSADAASDASQGTDSSSPSDAAADAPDASEAGVDSGTPTFGTSCTSGTTYSDTFATDPLTSGRWTSLIGTVTYDAANALLKLAAGAPNTQVWIGARPAWTNYTITIPVRIDSTGGNGGINFRMEDPGPANPPNDSGKMYYAGITTTGVQLGLENNGWTQLSSGAATFTPGTFYTLGVTANGTSLSIAVNGTTYVNATMDSTFSTGGFGLRTYQSGMSYGAVSVTCN